jgi:hypothetical protein
MHTSAFKTCRIHHNHNGDYGGDVIITNEDSTSHAIGTKASVKIDFKDVIATYIRYRERPETVVFLDKESNITVSFDDIESFVELVLIDRCVEKIETLTDIKELKQIARILGVKTNPDIVKEQKCPCCVGT